jgi:hypothetical protein
VIAIIFESLTNCFYYSSYYLHDTNVKCPDHGGLLSIFEHFIKFLLIFFIKKSPAFLLFGLIILTLLYASVYICLIIGTAQRNRFFILPALLVEIFGCAILVVEIFLKIITFEMSEKFMLDFFVTLAMLLFFVYLTLVFLSLYLKFRRESEPTNSNAKYQQPTKVIKKKIPFREQF